MMPILGDGGDRQTEREGTIDALGANKEVEPDLSSSWNDIKTTGDSIFRYTVNAWIIKKLDSNETTAKRNNHKI